MAETRGGPDFFGRPLRRRATGLPAGRDDTAFRPAAMIKWTMIDTYIVLCMKKSDIIATQLAKSALIFVKLYVSR